MVSGLQPGDARIGEKPPKLTVRLQIDGGLFDHEELTRRLGIKPTRAWRTGDPRRLNQPPSPSGPARHSSDGWRVQVGPRESFECGPLTDELLEMVAAASPALIKETVHELGLEGWVMLGVFQPIESTTPVMEVPREFVTWMAAAGLSLDVDIILSG